MRRRKNAAMQAIGNKGLVLAKNAKSLNSAANATNFAHGPDCPCCAGDPKNAERVAV